MPAPTSSGKPSTAPGAPGPAPVATSSTGDVCNAIRAASAGPAPPSSAWFITTNRATSAGLYRRCRPTACSLGPTP